MRRLGLALVCLVALTAACGSERQTPPSALRGDLMAKCTARVAKPAVCTDLVGTIVDIAKAKQCSGEGEANVALDHLFDAELSRADIDAIFSTCGNPSAVAPIPTTKPDQNPNRTPTG